MESGRARTCYPDLSTDVSNIPATFRLPAFLSVVEDFEILPKPLAQSKPTLGVSTSTAAASIPHRYPDTGYFIPAIGL